MSTPVLENYTIRLLTPPVRNGTPWTEVPRGTIVGPKYGLCPYGSNHETLIPEVRVFVWATRTKEARHSHGHFALNPFHLTSLTQSPVGVVSSQEDMHSLQRSVTGGNPSVVFNSESEREWLVLGAGNLAHLSAGWLPPLSLVALMREDGKPPEEAFELTGIDIANPIRVFDDHSLYGLRRAWEDVSAITGRNDFTLVLLPSARVFDYHRWLDDSLYVRGLLPTSNHRDPTAIEGIPSRVDQMEAYGICDMLDSEFLDALKSGFSEDSFFPGDDACDNLRHEETALHGLLNDPFTKDRWRGNLRTVYDRSSFVIGKILIKDNWDPGMRTLIREAKTHPSKTELVPLWLGNRQTGAIKLNELYSTIRNLQLFEMTKFTSDRPMFGLIPADSHNTTKARLSVWTNSACMWCGRRLCLDPYHGTVIHSVKTNHTCAPPLHYGFHSGCFRLAVANPDFDVGYMPRAVFPSHPYYPVLKDIPDIRVLVAD